MKCHKTYAQKKVKDHRSTSGVRSLAKRMNRLDATKKKTPFKHNTEISGIKPSCTQKFLGSKTLMHSEISKKQNPYAREDSKGYGCLKKSVRGGRNLRRDPDLHMRGRTATSRRRSMDC